MIPQRSRDRWYIYRYFEGTYQTDVQRFPSSGTLLDWMLAEGFERVEWSIADRIISHKTGREVLDDPILQKTGTSQLALLSDQAYRAGLQRIEEALSESEAKGEQLVFPVDVSMGITVGRLAG
jgi:hypothetical protein